MSRVFGVSQVLILFCFCPGLEDRELGWMESHRKGWCLRAVLDLLQRTWSVAFPCLAEPSSGCAVDGWIVYTAVCVCVRERRGEMERERRRDGIVETDGERERERERRGEKVLTILAVWGWFTSFSAELFVETKSGRRHRELLLGFRILANHRLDVRIWAWPPSTGTIAVNIFHPSQTSTVSLSLH